MIILLGIYSFSFLSLNEQIVQVDLLFLNLDIELGKVVLFSILIGILTTIILEALFLSSKRRKRDE